MTLQTAMAFRDFLIIASDTKALYCAGYELADEGPSAQELPLSKFVFSPSKKVACAYAGGPNAETAALNVALQAERDLALSEVEWRESLSQAVRRVRRVDDLITQLIVCRADNLELWVVSQWPQRDPTVVPIKQKLCTGNNSLARFLIEELYSPDLTLESAKSLALLALAFAARRSPSAVGEPFEILFVGRGDTQISKPEVYGLSEIQPRMQLLLKDMRRAVTA